MNPACTRESQSGRLAAREWPARPILSTNFPLSRRALFAFPALPSAPDAPDLAHLFRAFSPENGESLLGPGGTGKILEQGLRRDAPRVAPHSVAPLAAGSLPPQPFATAGSDPCRRASYLGDSNAVFGIEIAGDAHAYPKRILAWHERARDRVGGADLAIVYCTLGGTVIPYRATQPPPDGTSCSAPAASSMSRAS